MREYKVVFIDDEERILSEIMNAANNLISLQKGYKVSYSVLKNQDDVNGMNNIPADVVLFDVALGAAAFDFGTMDESRFGVELMSRFREKNERTQIILYSGEIKLKGQQCYEFTNEEMLWLINDLHVFKIIPKKVEDICNAIIDALDGLDTIIMSLEDLKEEYQSKGEFLVDGKLYPIDKMIHELKIGSKIGDQFRGSVLKMILTYMMKFGGDEE